MKKNNWLLLCAVLGAAIWFGPAGATDATGAAGGGTAPAERRQADGGREREAQTMSRAERLYQEKNYAEAAGLMRPLAEQGDARAAFALGLMEARGDLGEPDYAKARVWWEKAAAAAHPEAEYNLGLIYYRGVQQGGDGRDPSRRDLAAAVSWWEKAAEHGHGGAMYSLAGMARTGDGQPKNMEKAAAWYRRAAETGHPDAQYQLAGMCLGGVGLTKNEAEARKWMQKAADAGHPGAIQAMKLFKK